MILGQPWLQDTNSTINWLREQFPSPTHLTSLSTTHPRPSPSNVHFIRYLNLDPNQKIACLWKKHLNRYADTADDVWRTTITTKVAAKEERKKIELPLPFQAYADIFEKKKIDKLLPSHSFNYAIDLGKDFVPKVAKAYPLNPKEWETCKVFITEHLATGKIQPSRSLQVSLFFFISKKDILVCPCQDYHYLNLHNVKNVYPLPSSLTLLMSSKD